MFQTLPSEEHYKQIERDLINRKQPICLTDVELADAQEVPKCVAGGTTYTGYVLSQFDADCINRFTEELNRTKSIKVREYLKDRRHQQFCIIAEEITVEQLYKAESNREKQALLKQAS